MITHNLNIPVERDNTVKSILIRTLVLVAMSLFIGAAFALNF